jgi:hypothetical protein
MQMVSRKKMDKNWEPDWHIPNVSIRAAKILALPNYITLQNVFGAITCIDDIRWTRNAIVHNIPCSYQKYKEMALNKYRITNVEPAYLLQEVNPKTGNTIYQDWCTEIINVLNIAM